MLIINIALTKARLRNLQFKIDMIIKEHQDIYFTSQSKNTHVPRLKVAFRGRLPSTPAKRVQSGRSDRSSRQSTTRISAEQPTAHICMRSDSIFQTVCAGINGRVGRLASLLQGYRSTLSLLFSWK